MLQNGVDVRTLLLFFFFNDTATTEIYTHVDNDNLRMAAKANPLGRIKPRQPKPPESPSE